MSDEVQILFQNLSRMAEYTFSSISESWIASLVLNLLCYATVFVPGYLLIRYFKNSKYIERAGEFVFIFISVYPTCQVWKGFIAVMKELIIASEKKVRELLYK